LKRDDFEVDMTGVNAATDNDAIGPKPTIDYFINMARENNATLAQTASIVEAARG